MYYEPGQHVYVRFSLGCHVLTSHPMTIASVRSQGEAQFIIRVHHGITARLRKAAQLGKPVRVWLDGPYSGLNVDLSTFDHVLLIAGGTGISFVAPLMTTLAQGRKGTDLKTTVRVIVSVREAAIIDWLRDRFEEAQQANIDVELHVTGKTDEKDLSNYNYGRPDVTAATLAMFDRPGRSFIAACGATGMLTTIDNAFAKGQLSIAQGQSPADVQLHSELFNW